MVLARFDLEVRTTPDDPTDWDKDPSLWAEVHDKIMEFVRLHVQQMDVHAYTSEDIGKLHFVLNDEVIEEVPWVP